VSCFFLFYLILSFSFFLSSFLSFFLSLQGTQLVMRVLEEEILKFSLTRCESKFTKGGHKIWQSYIGKIDFQNILEYLIRKKIFTNFAHLVFIQHWIFFWMFFSNHTIVSSSRILLSTSVMCNYYSFKI